MTRVARIDDQSHPRIASIESLLTAGVAFGIFFICIAVGGYGDATNYVRYAAFGLSGSAIALAFMAGFIRRGPKVDVLAIIAFVYFTCAAVQDATTDYITLAVLDLFGALLSLAATRANLRRVLSGLRHWILIVIIVAVVPAFFGQGFNAGREWFGLLPGRYFGFSNPDALGFIAGLGILLSIPVLGRARGLALAVFAAFLFVIAATYTALFAVSLAVAAYAWPIKAKATQVLQLLTALLAAVSILGLAWTTTAQGLDAFEFLRQRVSLSRRTEIWVTLLQQSRANGHFWKGLGDITVANYTHEIGGAGTAHTTILQMLLSKGFLMTAFFILVAAIAAVRILGRFSWDSNRDQHLAIAVAVYWFVTSLVSSQPGTVMGFSLVIVVAISRYEESKEDLSGANRFANRLLVDRLDGI